MDSTTITIIIVIAVGLKYLVPYLVKLGEPKKTPQKSEWEYRVKFAKLNEELYERSNPEEQEELLYYFIQKLRQKDDYGEGSFQSMPKTLQVVHLINQFEAEVNNGGFLQFFINSTGLYSDETVKALNLIGAEKNKKLLEEALKLIHSHDIVPEHLREELNNKSLHEFINIIDFYDNDDLVKKMGMLDSKFFEGSENISQLKMEYFEKNKDEVWSLLKKDSS